ncbi:YvcK family protein [Candidatus Woesearchaeota archaeon]|jgi:uncharacterized cofD-like protein|nr:YvcK family protein [Candidatus Woesearchaeota archaeon]MBT6518304.1 YvcK family protein [Candidatus Woesearchaeota archaeon]MBT7367087.1 YvcK family protein [Candidatus Woesearchaeota archaeon]
MKKIVVIGGGSGIFNLLRGLKKYDCDITAIVSMMDSGGSTGVLRNEYGILPPGDIRKCLVALSESTDLMKDLFEHRFEGNGSLGGHSFGNLFLTALNYVTGSDENAILEASKILNIRGKVVPVTLDDSHLCVELEDGQKIIGETNIDIPKHNPELRIKKAFLSNPAKAHYGAIKAIEYADIVVIGPGDLFTSVVPNLLVEGISDALKKTNAKKVYVCNLMTKNGETNFFNAEDFVDVIEQYSKTKMDYVLVHDHSLYKVPKETLDRYRQETAHIVRFNESSKVWDYSKLIVDDYISHPSILRHDPEKLSKKILKL